MFPINDPHILLLAMLYLALVFIVGYSAVCAASKRGSRHWVELIALSYAIGAGMLPLLLFAISIIGFKPSRPILMGIATLALSTIIVLWKRQRLLHPTVPSLRHKADALSLLGFISAALIVSALCNIAARAAWPGLQDIDAFAIWMLKAKWVSLDALGPMPAVFRDPILSYSHQDYPLSLPLLVAGLYTAIGQINESAAKLLLLPTWLSLTGIVYAAIRRFHRRAIALAITAIFCTAPTLTSNASLLVAETPLLLALAGAMTLLLRWMETSETGDLVLTALFTAMAAFTKNEGLALLPVFASAALIVSLSRKSLKDFLGAASVCAVAVAPWLVYRTQLPRTHEDYGGRLLRPAILLHNLPQRSYILTQYLRRLFDAPRLGLIWYLLLLTTICAPTALRRGSTRVLWSILLIQLSLYLATFIVTPWDVQVLIPMITPKLQTQASAIAALLIALNLRDIPLANRFAGRPSPDLTDPPN